MLTNWFNTLAPLSLAATGMISLNFVILSLYAFTLLIKIACTGGTHFTLKNAAILSVCLAFIDTKMRSKNRFFGRKIWSRVPSIFIKSLINSTEISVIEGNSIILQSSFRSHKTPICGAACFICCDNLLTLPVKLKAWIFEFFRSLWHKHIRNVLNWGLPSLWHFRCDHSVKIYWIRQFLMWNPRSITQWCRIWEIVIIAVYNAAVVMNFRDFEVWLDHTNCGLYLGNW